MTKFNSPFNNWFIHFCPLDKQCRCDGIMWRLHVNTPKYRYNIALAPGSRFQSVRTPWTEGMGVDDLEWVYFERYPRESGGAGASG